MLPYIITSLLGLIFLALLILALVIHGSANKLICYIQIIKRDEIALMRQRNGLIRQMLEEMKKANNSK